MEGGEGLPPFPSILPLLRAFSLLCQIIKDCLITTLCVVLITIGFEGFDECNIFIRQVRGI